MALLRSCDLAAPAARPSAVALGRVRKKKKTRAERLHAPFARPQWLRGCEWEVPMKPSGEGRAPLCMLHKIPGLDSCSRCVLPHAKHMSYRSALISLPHRAGDWHFVISSPTAASNAAHAETEKWAFRRNYGAPSNWFYFSSGNENSGGV